MSVIQRIQEKYAKLMAIIIAVALMIFVVMLAFENGGNLFRGGNSTSVGKVNGTSIDYNDFMKKVDQQEKNMEAQYAQMGMPAPAGLQQQAIESAWSLELNDIIQQKELEKLGIKVGKKEMGDILYGPNAPEQWKRLFMRSDSDRFDGIAAKAQIDQMLKARVTSQEQATQREQLVNYINSLEQQRLDDKLTSLLRNSVNFPKWFVEKQIADESQMASISVVKDNYADHSSDSTIKVSDKEIQDYIDKNKEYYKQQESRSIAFVAFSIKPSAADSAAAEKKLTGDVRARFDTTTNVAAFLLDQGSATPYSETYAGKSFMQMVNKDTIQNLPINGVVGPYLDGGTYTLAKMIDKKELPDSVKCRHILLGTVDRQGQPIMEDSVAHKKADSIALAIKSGANFDTLETKYSTDKGSHAQKGVITASSTDIQAQFAKEFGQFILFDGKPGDKKVVKTQFGWHYIEILNFIKVEPHYKVAYLSSPIETSIETENNASNDANQFAASSRDQKSFDANAEKLFKARGFGKMPANEIPPSAKEVPGLPQSRTLVRNVYKAKLGEVLEPQKAGDAYVVAIVTEINEEGTKSIAKARGVVEPILRNKKLAENIIKKLGNITTLDAAAAALGNKPIAQVDSLRMAGPQRATSEVISEPRVIGAAFNTSNKGKVVPQAIEGRGAVWVIKVNDVIATSVANANVDQRRKDQIMNGKARAASPIQVLRETATIKDRRVNFF